MCLGHLQSEGTPRKCFLKNVMFTVLKKNQSDHHGAGGKQTFAGLLITLWFVILI